MKVLFVDHTSLVSGAERSLLELIALVRVDADVVLACPAGELMERARATGIPTVELGLKEFSFSSNVLSAAAGALRSGLELRRLARRHEVDVVHAASTRAGLLLAGCLCSRPRRVVDVRDVLPAGPRAAAVRWVLRLCADLIVFNSQFTRSRFGAVAPACATVFYPPVAIEQLLRLPLPKPEGRKAPPVLGLIGQITPWKGQDDAIRTLALVRQSHPDARLKLIGKVVFSNPSGRFDNSRYANDLARLIGELELADAVDFVGQTEDIRAELRELDVLLVPSWEEPFGRVVVEAMASGTPVAATARGGPAEIIENGVTGSLIRPSSPDLWAARILDLLDDPGAAREMARAARKAVRLRWSDAACKTAQAGLYDRANRRRPGLLALRPSGRSNYY